ncbi:MAG TPA: RnfABCDGE type electron transport complex subunit B [Methylibium sp.]|nr:RnfABCDGE type electron transport complex subunit B [Methylibium sp.]
MNAVRPVAVEAIDALLPQTQCTRCGYPDCLGYAEAIATGAADIDRCPPGGAEGIARLAALTGLAPRPLNPDCGHEGPRRLAVIDEAACIGCTRCIEACPVDCIVGAAKRMHSVIEPLCTGCELCLPACPVDCIALEDATPGQSGWAAWSPAQADEARARYRERQARRERDRDEQTARLAARSVAATAPPDADAARQAVIAAALARARAQRGG